MLCYAGRSKKKKKNQLFFVLNNNNNYYDQNTLRNIRAPICTCVRRNNILVCCKICFHRGRTNTSYGYEDTYLCFSFFVAAENNVQLDVDLFIHYLVRFTNYSCCIITKTIYNCSRYISRLKPFTWSFPIFFCRSDQK